MSEDCRSLIVTIVNRGCGDAAIETSMKAGAEGGTILFGRGIGIHEKKKILGLPIEPEKEIVLTVTSAERADAILDAIVRTLRLNTPGRGIAFKVPIDRFAGAAHLSLGEIPVPPEHAT